MKLKKKIFIIAFICFLVDQTTKLLAVNSLALHESIPILGNFFGLTYVINTGAAFSIFSGKQIVLIIVSLVALCYMINYVLKQEDFTKIQLTSYAFIIGGILGNLIDRIRLNHVVDFLDFKFFNYNFPIFNFSDIFLVIGTFMLIFSFKEERKKEI